MEVSDQPYAAATLLPKI